MRRVVPVVLSLLAAAGGAAPSPAPAAERGPVAVGIAAREFSLSLYERTVRPGRVRFNLTNFGEDGHDLVVLRPGGGVAGRLAEVPGGGGRGQLEVRLPRRGRYTLLCSIADHAARGMRVKLRVRQ